MTNTLPTSWNSTYGPLYYVAGLNSETNSHIFKAAVYNSTADVPVSLTFEGVGRGMTADLTILTAPSPYSMNEVGGSNTVERQTTTIKAGRRGEFNFMLPNLSVAVLSTN